MCFLNFHLFFICLVIQGGTLKSVNISEGDFLVLTIKKNRLGGESLSSNPQKLQVYLKILSRKIVQSKQ